MNTILFILIMTLGDTNCVHNNAVNIAQDERIETLVKKNVEYNKNNKVEGFRINIYSESGNHSRTAAFSAQAEFSHNFPETKSYVSFEEPYFKVQVGNYRNRQDAAHALETVKNKYPQAFIVRCDINIKDLLNIVDKVEEPSEIIDDQIDRSSIEIE